MHQPMTNRVALLAYWSVCQKLKHVSSVQLRRSVCAFTCRYYALASVTHLYITHTLLFTVRLHRLTTAQGIFCSRKVKLEKNI